MPVLLNLLVEIMRISSKSIKHAEYLTYFCLIIYLSGAHVVRFWNHLWISFFFHLGTLCFLRFYMVIWTMSDAQYWQVQCKQQMVRYWWRNLLMGQLSRLEVHLLAFSLCFSTLCTLEGGKNRKVFLCFFVGIYFLIWLFSG